MELSTKTTEYDPFARYDAEGPDASDIVLDGTRYDHAPEQSEDPLVVERVGVGTLATHALAWADLADRALEPNIFLEPAFALPLMQHASAHDRPDILLIWEPDGPTSFGRLIGLLPITRPGPVFRSSIVRAFDHAQSGRGTPLLDRDRAEEALEAALAWLHDDDPRASALLLRAIPSDGAFHALVSRLAGRVRCLREHRRAILERGSVPGDSTASAKRRKERRRQHRRLSEMGDRRYRSARTPAEIAAATEQFLTLEEGGWKGRRGTAMRSVPMLVTFTRAMTRLMAREGKCRIDSIEIDGRPVAMGIILKRGDEMYFWKTAFDETYRALSPGLQFALDLTDVQLADPTVAVTDSCAVPDHPMIDRIWPGRMAIRDLMIDLRPNAPSRFEAACAAECLRYGARTWAKAWFHRLFRRQR